MERVAGEAEHLESLSDVGEATGAALAVLSPRLTGRLAGSWEVVSSGLSTVVGSDLIYAAVQNYGGYHGIEGKRFVERAAAQAEDDAERAVTQDIDRLISRI